MKITCETLTELNSTIEQIIAKYEARKYIDDGSIWPLATQPGGVLYKRSIDPNAEEWLRTIATKARTCAINLFQQNPQLPEPPKPESEPLIELQQIRQWCIRAEAPTQPEQKQPASGGQAGDMNKPQEKDGQSNSGKVDSPNEKSSYSLFWKHHWKWIIGTSIALIGASIALIALIWSIMNT